MTPREQFIAWLNDARSTELAQIPVLENHAKDARDYPEIYDRDMQHLEETKSQAKRVEQLILDLGGSVSTTKTLIGKVAGLGHSVSTEIFPDELIKNFLADYAAEHFEIASYTSLIATAQLIGEDQCVPVLEEILAEEIAMARWLEEFIPFATAESLKVTTSEADSEYSSRSQKSGKKGIASTLTKPSVLAAIAGVGAIGAGAALLMRNKNKSTETTNTLSSGTTSGDLTSGSDLTTGSTIDVPEVTVVETVVIAVDESGSETAAASLDDTTTNGGNLR